MVEKFCIHCTHAVTHSPIMYCTKHTYLDLVTGDVKNISCSMARELERYCGQRAVHFQSGVAVDNEIILDDAPF
jgi:hypothetical protein